MNLEEKEVFAKEFYSRQVILKELGNKGQEKLRAAKVAVVGVGGLGTVSSLYLALAGVGNLRLIDQDVVEKHNLHRQILYSTEDLDYPKAEVAASRLQKINPLIKVEPVSENINSKNVEHLLSGVDLVVDGLDNIATRYFINRACAKLKITYIFGAAIGMEGNLSVFCPPETPCLECVLPNLSDNQLLNCTTRGVLGITPGIIGTMQAAEAIKVLTGIGTPLKGKLMICDFNDMSFTSIDIKKRTNCPACKGLVSRETKEKIVWLCGQNTAMINPEEPLKFDLNEVWQKAQQLGLHVHVKSQWALMFDYKNLKINLFQGGRMLIRNVPDEKVALNAYKQIRNELNLS